MNHFRRQSMVVLKSIKTGNMQKYLSHFWSILANIRFYFDVDYWSNMSISVIQVLKSISKFGTSHFDVYYPSEFGIINFVEYNTKFRRLFVIYFESLSLTINTPNFDVFFSSTLGHLKFCSSLTTR